MQVDPVAGLVSSDIVGNIVERPSQLMTSLDDVICTLSISYEAVPGLNTGAADALSSGFSSLLPEGIVGGVVSVVVVPVSPDDIGFASFK